MITYPMNWTIEFFDESVEAETFALPPKILAKMLHIFELIEMAGAQLGEPYTKPLNDGLFEVRAKVKEGSVEVSIVIKRGERSLSCTLL